jgi:hypothetical protein
MFVRLIGDLECDGAIFAFNPILLGPDDALEGPGRDTGVELIDLILV